MSKPEPPRFTIDDYIGEIVAIHEDTATCRVVLGSQRKRRMALLGRLGVLMQIGRPQIFTALKGAQNALDGKRE